ncbi:MAG: hypothetical protein QNJ12_10430 [Ilumatobacter sp.]|uniref:hypothetical protein n=1 Tax=Ilumatobacter sp. TaxID=1967498 RepID=UPI00261401CF|nr:hypothetical protein [Ilumatobacter sp.]MDJ0769203.1 hypothetical protein [Ilumatobacter sp.]
MSEQQRSAAAAALRAVCPALRTARHAARQRAGASELGYRILTLAEPRRRRDQLVGDATKIVVEGFGGSGNTFAVAALRLLGVDVATVAHHHHVPAQVTAGLRRGLPTFVIVRRPEPAVASLLRRDFVPSAAVGLRAYASFHERILPCASELAVVTFEQLTAEPERVLASIARAAGVEPRPDVDLADRDAVWRAARPGTRTEQAPERIARAEADRLIAAVPAGERRRAEDARTALLDAAGAPV